MQTETVHKKSEWQKPQWLQQALIVSLIANAALSFFSLVEWHETGYLMLDKFHYSPQKTYEVSFETSGSLVQSLSEMKEKEFSELVHLLKDDTLQFEGYRTRDLALSCLATCHQLHVQKPLTGALQAQEKRAVHVGDLDMMLFPGLSDEQFVALKAYVEQERFPFTGEGLFLRLASNIEDEGLKAACRVTPEYIQLETLFKNDASSDELLALASSVGYKELSEYFEGQKKGLSTTIVKKREFLVSLLRKSNKQAATLLVKIDRDYALQKLEDKDALLVLALLDNPDDFATNLLKSNRKAEVHKKALLALHKQNPEMLAKITKTAPDASKKTAKQAIAVAKNQPKESSARTHSRKVPTVKTSAAKAAISTKSYIVQTGDSLWRIAKKFNVAIHDIKRVNRLTSDDLKPGTTLCIPN